MAWGSLGSLFQEMVNRIYAVGTSVTYKRVQRDAEGPTLLEIQDGEDEKPLSPLLPTGRWPASPSSILPGRWLLVVVLCTLVSNICSIDRTAMGVAVLPMAQQYGWPDTVKGAVNGAFNIGYVLTNLLAGYLAARYSPKRTLSCGVLVWSAFTLLTPPAASSRSLALLLMIRALMGLGEGVAYPCMQVLVKTWVPADRRSRALGLVYSGHQIGSILALLISPGILHLFGWTWMFYLYGLLGFLWIAAWEPLVPLQAPLAGHSTLAADPEAAAAAAAGTAAGLAGGGSYAANGSSSYRHDAFEHQNSGELAAVAAAIAAGPGRPAALPLSITIGAEEDGEGALARSLISPATQSSYSPGSHSSPSPLYTEAAAPAAAAIAAAAGGAGSHRHSRASVGCSPLGEVGEGEPLRLRDVPWGKFAAAPAFWALVVAHSMFGVTYNLAMGWMPSYYNSVFGVDVKQSALLSVLPFVVMAVTTNGGGWVADALINHRVTSTTRTRKLLQAVGTATPALCLWYLAAVGQHGGSVTIALALLTAMLGGLGLQSGGFASTHQDVSTRYAGLIFGLTNACSSLAGSVSVYMTGVVLDATHSWATVFQLVAACNVVSCAAFLIMATSEPLFE